MPDTPANPPLRQLLGIRYGKGNSNDLLARALRDIPGAPELLSELERISLELSNPQKLPTTDRRHQVLQARHDRLIAWRDGSMQAIRSVYADTWRLGHDVNS